MDVPNYYKKVVTNIDDNLKSNDSRPRAVIVFFQNDKKLMEFFNSSEAAKYRDGCFILNEKVRNEEKENLVQRATYSRQVTFATREFGRGTDFICRDRKVEEAGGIHIIQTFLSEEESEEIQIKGRTSR